MFIKSLSKREKGAHLYIIYILYISYYIIYIIYITYMVRGNNMLNQRTEIISKYALASQDTIQWIVISDEKLTFLEIIEIFEAGGSLIYCSCEAD